jgi:hypothetical protein
MSALAPIADSECGAFMSARPSSAIVEGEIHHRSLTIEENP